MKKSWLFALAIGAIALIMLGGGFAFYMPSTKYKAEANYYLANITIYIWNDLNNSWTEIIPTTDNPSVRVTHYHEGGNLLATSSFHMDTIWQVDVGVEEELYNGLGDFQDIIIRVARVTTGYSEFIFFEATCNQMPHKKLYYLNDVIIDTDFETTETWTALPSYTPT